MHCKYFKACTTNPQSSRVFWIWTKTRKAFDYRKKKSHKLKKKKSGSDTINDNYIEGIDLGLGIILIYIHFQIVLL